MSFTMQTPARTGPGTFAATPASHLLRMPPNLRTSETRPPPVEQSQAAAPSNAQNHNPSQSLSPSQGQGFTPIERAARTINDTLAREARYPDLEAYVGQGTSADYDVPAYPAWEPFRRIKTYDFPDRIFEQFNHTQMSTMMGLFAEINHAWVAIDNQLYLWDYTHPNPELIGYEEQPHNIVAVKLIKPRSSVFVETVSHLLVVATMADVHLIGLSCEKGPEAVHAVSLYRTGMQVSVKGIKVGCIASSAQTGRIFFGDGRDTHDVFEITYQQEDGWFSSKCNKINHVRKYTIPEIYWRLHRPSEHIVQMAVDDTRNLLYTLSSASTIRVYHMKTAATLECVITRQLKDLRTMCSHMVRQTDLLFHERVGIIAIDAIAAPEASQLSLMATTSTGCRLFLSTSSGNFFGATAAAPSSMQVRHIRFPPPESPTPTNQSFSSSTGGGSAMDSRTLTPTVHSRRYAPGLFLGFTERPNSEGHVLFVAAPDCGRIGRGPDQQQSPRFMEMAQDMPLRGFVQDIGLCSKPFAAAPTPLGFGNELAVQFDDQSSEVAILTHTGVETIRRQRLVDTFAAIIKSGGGNDGLETQLRKFARSYGRSEMSATALAVACGQGFGIGLDSRIARVDDQDVLDSAKKAFIDFGGKAQLNENSTLDGSAVDNVRPSPRHDGLALYISRVVRSIWKAPVVKETAKPLGGPLFAPSISIPRLQQVQQSLIDLKEFLDANKTFIDGLAGPEALGRVTSKQDEVELQGENRALTSLVQLVNNIIEGISFVLVLFDERIDEIVLLLSPESRQRMRQLSFDVLFCLPTGKELAKELVKAIVNRNISKGSNVETVADALRRKCGSFCSADDVVIFKAQESLKKAADAGTNAERGRLLLNESLVLFERVAGSLGMENLKWAIDAYIDLEFYAGAIRLALKAAQDMDRGNQALSWIREDRPAQDARETAFQTRTACYDLAHSVIEAVDDRSDGMSPQCAKRRDEAYTVVNESEDEVFQMHLYDWYLAQGWNDRLLNINSRFVVGYLQRKATENATNADLLCRYHAAHYNYLEAAQVQADLAKSGFRLSLDQRIEYLSRAKANASTRITGLSEMGRSRQSRQELLRTVSDLLDIANIQGDILQRMKSDGRLVGGRREEVLAELDGHIMSLDLLYNQYADQAGYYDICIFIYFAADYRNPSDIASTWSNVIDQAHTDAELAGRSVPWEAVIERVRATARRVSSSEAVFPVGAILSMLLVYYVRYYTSQDPQPAALPIGMPAPPPPAARVPPPFEFPIDVFESLQAPFEPMIGTLETLWYAHEGPWNSSDNRQLLVKWLVYAVEKWERNSQRLGGVLFGSEENAVGVAELLRSVLERKELAGDGWSGRATSLRSRVDGAVR